MWADTVLEDVRAAREAIAARYNYDLDALVADLQKREAQSGRTVVQPKKTEVNGVHTPPEKVPGD